jgi:hypothetical protein
MKYKFSSIILIAFFLNLFSCTEEEGNKIIFIGDPSYVSVASKDNGDVMCILYQKEERVSLNVGYNDLYLYFRDMKKELSIDEIEYNVKIYLNENSGEVITGAIFPNSASNSLRLFKIPTYFIKASNNNKWIMEISYSYKGKNYNEIMELEVGDNPLYSSFEYDNKTYFINQIQPKIQRIGVLDFDFVIIEKDNDTFKYFNYFTCDIKVYNSKRETNNNADPINKGDGYYKGTIYVPEIGAWQVESNFYIDSNLIYTYNYPIFIKTEE